MNVEVVISSKLELDVLKAMLEDIKKYYEGEYIKLLFSGDDEDNFVVNYIFGGFLDDSEVDIVKEVFGDNGLCIVKKMNIHSQIDYINAVSIISDNIERMSDAIAIITECDYGQNFLNKKIEQYSGSAVKIFYKKSSIPI